MNDTPRLTAEQFASTKLDLPEGGRWSELVAGRVETLDPPDVGHGTFVLNLSKALAAHLHETDVETAGYACFELGLVVARNPDTVRCPPLSYFSAGDRFAEADKLVTETRPALVVEIASTNIRRRQLSRRVEEFLELGVEMLWVADPDPQVVHVIRPGRANKRLAAHQTLIGSPVLRGFSIRVEELFAVPRWWNG